MENKYQDSLDCIKQYIGNYNKRSLVDDFINDIQELVDNYAELLDKFNEQSISYGNCCIERKKLEQALDKFCYKQAREWYKGNVCANEWFIKKRAEEIKENYLKESGK